VSLLHSANPHCVRGIRNQSRPSMTVISYPPPATGVNYNLIDKVEHELNDKVIWKIVRSPDGHFVYDHVLKSKRRTRRQKCPGSQDFLEPGQRKCIKCQSETRKARNRRYYQSLKERIKTGSS
jgi:hypothetical protein